MSSPRSPRTPSRASSRISNKTAPQSPRVKKEVTAADIESKYPDLLNPDISEYYSSHMNKRLDGTARKSPVKPRKDMKMTDKLRILKQIAISNCDYDKSDAIQKYIELKMVDNTSEVVGKASEWISEVLEDALKRYTGNVTIITDDATDKKLRIRSGCDECFKDVRKKHINELTDIETERQIELIKEENRVPGYYTAMKEESQRLARNNDRAGAKTTIEKAEALLKERKAQKKKEIHSKYNAAINAALERQEKEIEALQDRLQSELSTADDMAESDLDQERKKMVVCIKSTIKMAVDSSIEHLEKVETRSKVTKALTDYTKKFLKERGHESLLN